MRLRFVLALFLPLIVACVDPNPSAATEQDNPWIPYTPLTANSAMGDTPPEIGAPTDEECSKMPLTDWRCLKLPPGLPPMAAQWPGPTKGYATLCAQCHGIDGKGSDRGRQLGAKDLSSSEVQGLTDEQIANVIKKGSNNQKMPSFSDTLSDPLVKDLVNHVRLLPSKKFAPMNP